MNFLTPYYKGLCHYQVPQTSVTPSGQLFRLLVHLFWEPPIEQVLEGEVGSREGVAKSTNALVSIQLYLVDNSMD